MLQICYNSIILNKYFCTIFPGYQMHYILITAAGNRVTFSVKEAAELYQILYGGYIVTSDKEDLPVAA